MNELPARRFPRPELALRVLLAGCIFFMMCVTFTDVVGRYFFGMPLPAAYEMTEFMMTVAIFSALPIVTGLQKHVTVSLFDRVLWRGRKNWQQTFVSLFGAAVMATLTRQIFLRADRFAEYQDHTLFLQLPIAPLAYFMAAMAAATTVVLLVLAWTGLRESAPPPADTTTGGGPKSGRLWN